MNEIDQIIPDDGTEFSRILREFWESILPILRGEDLPESEYVN